MVGVRKDLGAIRGLLSPKSPQQRPRVVRVEGRSSGCSLSGLKDLRKRGYLTYSSARVGSV